MTTENNSTKFPTQGSEEEESKDDSSIFDFKQEQAQMPTKPNQQPTTEHSPQIAPNHIQTEDFPLVNKDQESLSSGISSNNNTPKKTAKFQSDVRRFSSD